MESVSNNCKCSDCYGSLISAQDCKKTLYDNIDTGTVEDYYELRCLIKYTHEASYSFYR